MWAVLRTTGLAHGFCFERDGKLREDSGSIVCDPAGLLVRSCDGCIGSWQERVRSSRDRPLFPCSTEAWCWLGPGSPGRRREVDGLGEVWTAEGLDVGCAGKRRCRMIARTVTVHTVD